MAAGRSVQSCLIIFTFLLNVASRSGPSPATPQQAAAQRWMWRLLQAEFDESYVGPNRRPPLADYAKEEDYRKPRRGSLRGPSHSNDDRRNYEYDEFHDETFSHSHLIPSLPPGESSEDLVEKFRSQVPPEASLPAVLRTAIDSGERAALLEHDPEAAPRPSARLARRPRGTRGPPRPLFARPLRVRAVLAVPRAGFSETYTAWWDPISGDSRVHFNGGSTVTWRKALRGGMVQRIEMHVDRTDGHAVRRCGAATTPAGAADRAHPALPDTQLFTFAGYEESDVGQVERWQRREETRAGAAGGEGGEALSVLHQLVVARDAEDAVRPLRYEVTVDSSVLGARCDTYRHDYWEASYHNRGPEFFDVSLAEHCDEVKQLNVSEPDDLARLEPLREFTLLQRDPRYDVILDRFKSEYNREYVDGIEEVVRKNVLMQNSRFVSSGNRAGATFQLGLNFLGDRLEEELARLRGAAPGTERVRAARFPHSRAALSALERRLPDAFDWRAEGGVSDVRFQGAACASCWALAVAGAVEGAVFARTRSLTPLAEQQLVDCAHPFGGRGCSGTWPSHAYAYVSARGLAARARYAPYRGRVGRCGDAEVPPAARIAGHVNVTKYSVPALQVAISRHGPVVVLVDTPPSFTLYRRGVLYDERCSKKSTKHAVLAVGWGHEKGEPFFILKNTWSSMWGEAGYIRVQARANTCGVLTHPSYPRLDDRDFTSTDTMTIL